ncbi:MAG TPA: LON peptidase substrate-binding domain-containing protein [Magnetospirillaceae bacterium]|jgi:hypothetical protein
MPARSSALRYEDLPAVLPIFPLPGAVLLPEGRLPLNIFEPRYLAMIEDALAAKRLIGMIQPTGPVAVEMGPIGGMSGSIVTTPPDKNTEPALYETGCAGRIVSFTETGDGRFLITLAGVCRFRVAREVEGARGYRRVTPDWKPFRSDMEPPANAAELNIERPKLLAALRGYLALNEMEVDWSAIEGAPDAALAIVLTMSCPFEPREKQALLECATPTQRASLLVALMEMAIVEGRSGGAPMKQ